MLNETNALVVIPATETIVAETIETPVPAIAAKPAKSAKPEAATVETEAPAEALRDVAAERAAIRALCDGFGVAHITSFPIKTTAAFKPKALTPNANGRSVSYRQCATIAIALAGSGKKLKAGVKFPRHFKIDGAEYCIENGAGGDMLASGLATLTDKSQPAREILTIDAAAVRKITGQLGSKILSAAKLI